MAEALIGGKDFIAYLVWDVVVYVCMYIFRGVSGIFVWECAKYAVYFSPRLKHKTAAIRGGYQLAQNFLS